MIERWQYCPSTHCERSQECRSPHDCSARKAIAKTAAEKERFAIAEDPRIAALTQENERLREALGWIRDLAPATMEVTVASQMADIATEALAKGQTP